MTAQQRAYGRLVHSKEANELDERRVAHLPDDGGARQVFGARSGGGAGAGVGAGARGGRHCAGARGVGGFRHCTGADSRIQRKTRTMSSTVRTPSFAAFSSRRRRRAARHLSTVRRRASGVSARWARHTRAHRAWARTQRAEALAGLAAALSRLDANRGFGVQPAPRRVSSAPGAAEHAHTRTALSQRSAHSAQWPPQQGGRCRRRWIPAIPLVSGRGIAARAVRRTANCANFAARSEASASGSSKPSRLRRSAASCGLGVLDCMVCSQLDLGASCSHVQCHASDTGGAAGRRRAATACARRRSLGLGAFGVAPRRSRQLRRRGSAHRVRHCKHNALVRAPGLRLRCARRREPANRRVVGPRPPASPRSAKAAWPPGAPSMRQRWSSASTCRRCPMCPPQPRCAWSPAFVRHISRQAVRRALKAAALARAHTSTNCTYSDSAAEKTGMAASRASHCTVATSLLVAGRPAGWEREG